MQPQQPQQFGALATGVHHRCARTTGHHDVTDPRQHVLCHRPEPARCHGLCPSQDVGPPGQPVTPGGEHRLGLARLAVQLWAARLTARVADAAGQVWLVREVEPLVVRDVAVG